MKIGFVILSHGNPLQLWRLVRTLNAVYGDPPIVCHHDYSQARLNPRDFPANIAFVDPHFVTRWGDLSVVKSALAALELLFSGQAPDWFVLLSAGDYPVAPAERVHADLAGSEADVLLDFHQALPGPALLRAGPHNPALSHFLNPANRLMLKSRYLNAQIWLPIVRRSITGQPRIGRYTQRLNFNAPNYPFKAKFECFFGDHWFSGTKKAARVLLAPNRDELRLQRYLRFRDCVDECYYQSVLCNRPEIIKRRDNLRFAKWHGGGAHPAFLTMSDLADIKNAGAHFARKFRHDDPVLDEIDEWLGISDKKRF